MSTVDISHSHRFPWNNHQRATVALSAILPIIFTLVMFAASGQAGWLALALLSPVTGWWSYRANQSRKERSKVQLTIRNGSLKCFSSIGDTAYSPVVLTRINRVSRIEFQGRPAVVISSLNENGSEDRQRIPFRIFTPNNPVGPLIIESAKANNVDVSDSLIHALMGFKSV